MKFEFDRKYFKICLYAFLTVAALLLFNRILQASVNIWQSVVNTFVFLLELLSPFIVAIIIAYILSPAVSGIEIVLGKVFRKESQTKGRKLAALLLVYAATVTVIALTLSFVIPGIVRNIGELINSFPYYWGKLDQFYKNDIVTHPLLSSDDVKNAINSQLDFYKSQLPKYMTSTVSALMGFVLKLGSSIASGIIGLVLSFYLLNERENIVESFHHLLKARLGDKRSSAIMSFLDSVDKVFGRYISAKLLIALVMFVITFVVFTFLNVPYGVLMSAIVALSTLVPYIGPFIGAVPPILISLIDSPQKAIYVAISILLIHSVDGYFIEPYVFSDRMGLSPFWILLSIILGGGLFGLWGILLAVPVAAVIKLLIVRYIRGRQLRRRKDQDITGEGSGAAPQK